MQRCEGDLRCNNNLNKRFSNFIVHFYHLSKASPSTQIHNRISSNSITRNLRPMIHHSNNDNNSDTSNHHNINHQDSLLKSRLQSW